MPKVDIIIPAYNSAKYLPEAIKSVMAQTFTDWRILLVDDGSIDNTFEVISLFLRELGSGKINYIRQTNLGVSAARNAGIKNSSAEFLALLDADDVWLPTRLFESLKCFESRPDVGLAYGLISRIDQAGELIDTWRGNERWAEGNIASHIYMLKSHLPCSTVTLRRKCIDEVGVFDEQMRATEDRDLWLRIAQRYAVAFTPNVIAYYRTSPGSLSADPERMLTGRLKFIGKHYGGPFCGLGERRNALGTAYQQHAEALKTYNQLGGALASSLKAFVFSPLHLDHLKTVASILLKRIKFQPHS